MKGFHGSVESIVLFGSTARGESEPRSDIDLFVLTSGYERDRFEREREAYWALGPVRAKYRKDTTVFNLNIGEAEDISPMLMNIAYDGVILYDASGEGERLLASIREAVDRAGLVRYKIKDVYGWKTKRPLKWGEVISVELKKPEHPR